MYSRSSLVSGGGQGDSSDLAFGAVLEAAAVATGAVVGPLSADVGPGRSEVEFTPVVVRFAVAPCLLIPDERGEFDIPAAQADGFFRAQATVVKSAEERDQPRTAGLLGADRCQQRSRLGGVDDDLAVDLVSDPGRPPFDVFERVLLQHFEFDRVVERVEQDGPVPAHRRGCGTGTVEAGDGRGK